MVEVKVEIKNLNNLDAVLKAYIKQNEKKASDLMTIMLSEGADTAQNLMGHIDSGNTLTTIKAKRRKDSKKGRIVADGAAIWLEFGTGVVRNQGFAHPPTLDKSKVPIYKHGEYGKGQGKSRFGWFYYDANGKLRHTYGITANMFMYKTYKSLLKDFPELAKEVFSR